MNYQDIIQKALEEAAEKKKLQSTQEQRRLEHLQQQCSIAKAKFDSIVLAEIAAAQTQLDAAGVISEQGNGNLPHGTRRSLIIQGKTLAFIGLFDDATRPPELLYRIEERGSHHADPLYGSTPIGKAENFTREEVRTIIIQFLTQALNP